MKLAYIGYDKNVFKSYNFLAPYFQEIDTYLINYDNDTSDTDVTDLPLMTGNVYIGKNSQLYTEKQKASLAQVNSEYIQLTKSIITTGAVLETELSEVKLNKNYYRAKDIIFLEFDKNTNKYFIETKHQGRFEYDYMVIQNHRTVSNLFAEKQQNVFKGCADQDYVLLNLEFAVKPKLGQQVEEQEFVFVENPVVKSIFDNWYVCKVDASKISINFYIPFNQQHSDDFINFLVERVRKIFAKEFITFELVELLNKTELATNGFSNQSIKIKNKSLGAIFPSFTYWSENRVADFIQNIFLNKNKNNKIFFSEKETP